MFCYLAKYIPHTNTFLCNFAVAVLGFELDEGGGGTSVEILEGETRDVCVILLEPESCDILMEVNVAGNVNPRGKSTKLNKSQLLL